MTSVMVTGIGFFMFCVIVVVTGDDCNIANIYYATYLLSMLLIYKMGGNKMRTRGL